MIKVIVNKLKKYGLYDTKAIKWLKLRAIKFTGRHLKKHGLACLKLFNEIMGIESVEYWTDYGTLLGIYREGKFIEHDFDIDFGIKQKEYNRDIEKRLIENGFKKTREYYAFGQLVEQTWKWNGVLVDIFLYKEEGEKLFAYEFYQDGETTIQKIDQHTYKCTNLDARAMYVPNIKVMKYDFMGFKINVPEEIETYLIANYGPNFMVPDKDWDSSKANNIVEIRDIEMEEYIYK